MQWHEEDQWSSVLTDDKNEKVHASVELDNSTMEWKGLCFDIDTDLFPEGCLVLGGFADQAAAEQETEKVVKKWLEQQSKP